MSLTTKLPLHYIAVIKGFILCDTKEVSMRGAQDRVWLPWSTNMSGIQSWWVNLYRAEQLIGCVHLFYRALLIAEPEFRDVLRRLKRYLFVKRYLFRGLAVQQGFQLFSCRDAGKPYFVHSFRTTYQKVCPVLCTDY
jgi:hypothetical protein